MGTKTNPGEFDCYGNALPDEPMFILLARDPSAPSIVRTWAMERRREILAGRRPTSDERLVDEALTCADAMERWREENDGRWRR